MSALDKADVHHFAEVPPRALVATGPVQSLSRGTPCPEASNQLRAQVHICHDRGMRPSAEPKSKGHFKMIEESDFRKTCLRNSRTVHTKTEEICHPTRCVEPLRKITKPSEILKQFVRAIFKMIGESDFRKKCLQNNRTVH